MTLVNDPLVDPRDTFLAQDPTVLSQEPSVPAEPVTQEHVVRDLAVAVIGATYLMRRLLHAEQPAAVIDIHAQAVATWEKVAPAWLRAAVPAIRHAYALGEVRGLSDAELEQLATDYAGAMGDYVNQSSAEALQSGMDAQLAQRWSADVAWHRATEAYGLDRRNMLAYIRTATKDGSSQIIPSAARLLVDKAFMRRAENLGEQEAYSAQQCGQVLAWQMLERQGRLPAGSRRQWEMGANEEHCATCLELAGQVVLLADPFLFVSGAKIWAPRAHPGCHCRVRLLPPEVAKRGSRNADRVTVAGICVQAADTRRVLMLQRAHDPKDPAGGLWEFPGGHLERNETPRVGAQREWEEECRRRLPATTQVGSWRHGIYEGFVLQIPQESAIPSHRRGRVANPDDPDGDQVEAIAWWDPAHLAGNKAVRPELLDSLPELRAAMHSQVGKAYDPKEKRDAGGRWATTAAAERQRTTVEDLVGEPEQQSFLAPANAFLGQQSHLAQTSYVQTQSFLGQEQKTEAKQAFLGAPKRAPRTRVVHDLAHRVVILPATQPTKPASANSYYLPVDSFHEKTPETPIGGRYDLGYQVNFDRAIMGKVVAHAHASPWNLLSEDHIFFDKTRPNDMGDPVPRSTIENHWSEIAPLVQHGWNVAMSEVDAPDNPLAQYLNRDDLKAIYSLAGWDPGENNPDVMRQRIVKAVQNVDQGDDDSLAMAYGDYVVYADPIRFLGTYTGGEIERALEAAERDGIELRQLEAVPTEQVFGFENGLHPGTHVSADQAVISGRYNTKYHRYRSAIHDFGVPPPLRVGLRETYVEPFEDVRPARSARKGATEKRPGEWRHGGD